MIILHLHFFNHFNNQRQLCCRRPICGNQATL